MRVGHGNRDCPLVLWQMDSDIVLHDAAPAYFRTQVLWVILISIHSFIYSMFLRYRVSMTNLKTSKLVFQVASAHPITTAYFPSRSPSSSKVSCHHCIAHTSIHTLHFLPLWIRKLLHLSSELNHYHDLSTPVRIPPTLSPWYFQIT